ncbi:MAG: putative short-chain dehydrogenase/reductase [Hydrocarboniphaga sp.]|uniref:SDR family NAD(P)-dependent oxidoreductase n=1 Tax=Hydrocarboniphaga sp. TaxID=2033016 RepID=UPI00260B5D26|nr:SDR family NAD(P)-dependent oxidoreductase [Hydrocarboniphaga sp.]MDB5972827.1 putative short-chain dehydrogenase/reductase [Hydrocarboniphaga sp.]
MSKVWLVTGSASGLGRHISEAVLASGDRLVATARNTSQLDDLQARYGGQMRVVALDVTDAAAAKAAVAATLAAFGRIDVLVNNAGYGAFSPFEQTSEGDFRAQIDTNFYGVVNLSRAVMPTMRQQRSGHIIQISSVGGRMGTPGLSAYQAAKWAVGGFSEVLAMEAAAFGVKVCVLEPGGMKTNWGPRATGGVPDLLPDYQPSVGAIVGMHADYAGKENSDPVKVADVVLQIAHHDQPPVHLLLGSDAVHYCGQVDAARAASAEAWKAVSKSVDFNPAANRSFAKI